MIYLLGCLIYTVVYWDTLSYEEGWGVVGMIGLMGIGLVTLAVDGILRLLIKNRLWNNLTGLVIFLILAILLLAG